VLEIHLRVGFRDLQDQTWSQVRLQFHLQSLVDFQQGLWFLLHVGFQVLQHAKMWSRACFHLQLREKAQHPGLPAVVHHLHCLQLVTARQPDLQSRHLHRDCLFWLAEVHIHNNIRRGMVDARKHLDSVL
jgi:hypothetical protein